MILSEWINGATALVGGVAGLVLISIILRLMYDRKVYNELKSINNNLEKILWMKVGGKKK